MIKQRLSPDISEVLGRGATLIVPTAQRQAAVRAAWAEQQWQAGRALWQTPRVLTFSQYCERELQRSWARDAQPDRLLSPAAEWAVLREARRDAGGPAEARALLSALHTLSDWRIPRSKGALAATPEATLLHETFLKLEQLFATHGRKPLRTWLDALEPDAGTVYVAGFDRLPAAHAEALRRVGAKFIEPAAATADITVAVADHDEHELELIASWCRRQLERDPGQRLLIVDANLRRRRSHYERLLSQTLSPSDWLGSAPRDASPVFSIEGGRPLAEFPIISHALLSLRLLSGQLRFAEAAQWLNLPFLDRDDVFAGASVEALLRDSHRLEYGAEELAGLLERGHGTTLQALAARLRQAMALLSGERRSAAEWAPQLLQALVALGWPGTRALRSDELQAMTRWHALLDEYSALGAWLPRAGVSDAIGTLCDLAAERNFDPASVEAPVTLTDSHDDPLVRYDAIWVAGLDAAQWPAAPRPDAFIPLRLQVTAGIPSASAAGQAALARASLDAWRRSGSTVVCSWARLEGDAHRSPSPLLMHIPGRTNYQAPSPEPALASRFQGIEVEIIEDLHGIPVDTRAMVAGGVKPLALQAECGFHAYAELRLGGRELEVPAPGLDARQRGMLLHKALELIWTTLNFDHFHLHATNEALRRPLIGNAVAAAIVSVFRGYVPVELRPAVERERFRVERLVEALLKVEWHRNPFKVDKMEARRVVQIGGGQFELRIDRIDNLEGGGFAILDYKSGEPRALRWDDERGLRDPQLIAYLLAERGRNVQALANVSLTRGRAKFVGRSAHKGLLPEVSGPSLAKTPAAEIESTWQGDVERWLSQLQQIAAAYIAGAAPVQPAPDTCRLCHLTTLCRRMELAAVHAEGAAHE